MAHLIDTNIAIHARDGDDGVLAKLAIHAGAVFLSAISLVELERGLFKDSVNTVVRQARLQTLLAGIPVLAFDKTAAEAYGQIIAQCGWTKSRDFDRMIAAHAMSTSSILVTNNETDFRDIPGLDIENWAAQ